MPRRHDLRVFTGAISRVLAHGADAVIVVLAGLLANAICSCFHFAAGHHRVFTVVAITVGAAFAMSLAAFEPATPSIPPHLRLRIVVASLAGGWIGGALWCKTPFASEAQVGMGQVWWGVAALCASLLMVAATTTLTRLLRPGLSARRVAVVGVNDYSKTFIKRLQHDISGPDRFVGLYHHGALSGSSCNSDERVMGNIIDLVERTRLDRIDAIVLALPLSDHDVILQSRAALGSVIADIYVAAEVLDLTCKSGRVDRIGGHSVIKVASRPLTEWQIIQKSAIDFVLAIILLVATLPMLMLVAVAIKIDSPGPVLFKQQRLGFNNLMFEMFKFRTMFHHMADAHADRQTTRGDARVTRVGRFLRRTSIDELPQLLNLLRGEMSLVGPRPHAANTKAADHLFHDVVADYALRHRVKPGITGWAQVNGWRGETRTFEQIEQRVAHDLYYIDNWSLMLDIKVIMLTALRELNSKVAF